MFYWAFAAANLVVIGIFVGLYALGHRKEKRGYALVRVDSHFKKTMRVAGCVVYLLAAGLGLSGLVRLQTATLVLFVASVLFCLGGYAAWSSGPGACEPENRREAGD